MSTPIGPRDRIPLKPGKHDVSFVTSDKRLTVETLIRAGEEAKIVRDLNDSLDIKEPTSNRAQKLATGTDKEKVANGLLDEARLLAKTDPARARNLCRKVMELFANSPKVPKVQEAYRLLGDIKGGKDKDDDF